MTTLTTHLHKEGAGGSYFGHIKIGLNMVVWSIAVFITSSIHAIFPFVLEKSSMAAAKKLASLVQETFAHHEG
tara:strand:+ start:37395 stop:37613 length:219 start_codon:yes stop_codon:yes gene_type:complete